MCTGIGEAALIAGIAASLAGSAASTGLALSKGGPKLPPVEPPAPLPPAPPPPAPLPPAPTETEVDASVTRERRRRQQRFGVADTLLASPLGGQTVGNTLLGGGR